MLWANRNGFFYVLDRETGEFLHGKNFVKVTWAKGLDENGRPIKIPEASPTREGTRVWPAVQGGTNWYSPAYNEKTGLFYVSSWEYSSVYHKGDPSYTRGNRYVAACRRESGRTPWRTRTSSRAWGAVRALSPTTGDMEWEFRMTGVGESGILSTAGDILVTGTMEGYLLVLDVFHRGESTVHEPRRHYSGVSDPRSLPGASSALRCPPATRCSYSASASSRAGLEASTATTGSEVPFDALASYFGGSHAGIAAGWCRP